MCGLNPLLIGSTFLTARTLREIKPQKTSSLNPLLIGSTFLTVGENFAEVLGK